MPKHERKAERREYLEQNPVCELDPVLRGVPEYQVIFAKFVHANLWGGECVHHVARRRGTKWDTVPNFLTVSRAGHAFVHEYETWGLIACLWVKAWKGEFCGGVINECIGMPRADADPLWAFLTDVKTLEACELTIFEKMRREVLAFLTEEAAVATQTKGTL